MPKIFISYRRLDSQYVTDIVYDKMAQHFGKENVFLDVGSIPFGVDFRTYLNEQVAAHDVVLVIIGSDWARIMQERSDQQNDFVRIEIESALKQGKLVIPVLVKNASMPNFSNLPEGIQELQWRNSAVIRRQPDLENDCTRLAEGIRQFTNSSGSAAKVKSPKPTSLSLMPAPFDWIEIPNKGYSIAKYPVTNAQFAKFIDAGGYKTQKWWTEQGWQQRQKDKWLEPRFWQDSKWNGDTQPVVGVSWYESVAFCLWLSDTTGKKIMLPTEAQWQYAAQGDDGRNFPWGNNWNRDLCNNSVGKKGISKTSHVTQHEGKGDSLFGVVDMVGNVWEWCLTDHENKTNNVNSDANSRVLRGGSWLFFNTDFFLCDNDYGGFPHDWGDDLGFRVSRS